MKKSAKQHLVYGGIMLVIIIGLLFYHNYQITQTRLQITAQFTEQQNILQTTLTQQIQTLQTQLTDEIYQLQEKDVSLEQNVKKLDTSIEQKDKEIKELGGELKNVQEKSQQQVEALEQSITTLKTEYQDFSEVIENSVKSVVSIQTNIGSGSGFIIDTEGHVVTNYHVIERATAANIITHDGERHKVFLTGFNKNADIAVLQIESTDYSRLRFADSDNVKVGEKVIAIGNPGGLDFTVTQGIISAERIISGNEYLQIDVPINPGNSGGPLINSAGRVVGVNTLKRSDFEGVGFALSSNYVQEIVDGIIE